MEEAAQTVAAAAVLCLWLGLLAAVARSAAAAPAADALLCGAAPSPAAAVAPAAAAAAALAAPSGPVAEVAVVPLRHGHGSHRSSRSSGSDGQDNAANAAGAGCALLRLTHRAFPLASLWDCRERLLGSGEGRPRINGRTFSLRDAAGARALAAFQGALLAPPLPAQDSPVPAGVARIDLGGAYTSAQATEVEIGCLLMLPHPQAPAWDLALEGGPSAAILIDAPELRAAGEQPLAQPLPPPPRPRRGAFSSEHYPLESNMYVLGEVHSPRNRADGLARSAQKLLQLERALRLLCAREGGLPVAQCVLGVVLIGPHVTPALCAALARTLGHYRQRLPCLWDLQQRGRFLGLRQLDFFPEVAALHVSEALVGLRTDLSSKFDAMLEEIKALRGEFKAVREEFKEVREEFKEVREEFKALRGDFKTLREEVRPLLAPQQQGAGAVLGGAAAAGP